MTEAERAKGAIWMHLTADDLAYLFEVVCPAAHSYLVNEYFEDRIEVDEVVRVSSAKKRWLDSAKAKGYVGHPDE